MFYTGSRGSDLKPRKNNAAVGAMLIKMYYTILTFSCIPMRQMQKHISKQLRLLWPIDILPIHVQPFELPTAYLIIDL